METLVATNWSLKYIVFNESVADIGDFRYVCNMTTFLKFCSVTTKVFAMFVLYYFYNMT